MVITSMHIHPLMMVNSQGAAGGQLGEVECLIRYSFEDVADQNPVRKYFTRNSAYGP
jgi:hypothetical protein